ncbi:hypothetical protein WJX82_000977 [Trebouxia sp. C0006]
MDVPDCDYGSSGTESCVGDSNVFCCAHGGNGTGGTDCVNPYTTSNGCAEGRPNFYCCFGEIALGLSP